MAQMSFGTILQDERERKGLDVSSVARRLRIRPDILQAIEASDFSRMPPRGYARNMVNAYARYLGLNPTEITRMYLDEAYAEQVKKARSNAQPSGFDMSGGSSRRASSSRKGYPYDDEGTISSVNGRVLMVDSNTSRYRNTENAHQYGGERTHRSTQSALPRAQYTNFYAGPQADGSIQSKLPLIIAGAVILVVLIILLVFLFGPKGNNTEDIQKVPVTGVDDTTQTPNGEEEDQVEQATVAPTKATVSYKVTDGQTVYLEVYVDDAIKEAGDFTGPASGSYDISDTSKIRIDVVGNESITISVDGVDQTLTDDNGDGVYSITVDFQAILQQWYTDHPTPNTTDTTAGTGAGTAENAVTPSSTDTATAGETAGTTEVANTTENTTTQ